MKLTHDQIRNELRQWYLAWNDHDLEKIMELFHKEILFENWTGGRVQGREALRKAWTPWFAHHGGF